ncbi:chromosome partitioning protein ParA [Photobacterium sp. TY1-4]|uniref:chromosome partitioning protein ParA n=1 Tax=Photobacterium sp. TY1-4 TaxID=2899122 RepID=UPI0021C0356A|nr:chromosome partitioning protein ParA [Photobacterium sp. TY1-4]UXI03905.1 chromosome partitioning protein ParA [Photobacterium sp. TY1-4]
MFPILMLAAMAGMFLVFESDEDAEVPTGNRTGTAESREVHTVAEHNFPAAVTGQSTELTSTVEPISVTASQSPLPANLEANSQILNQASGRELRDALEAFWLACGQQENCLHQLRTMEGRLDADRYALLADYPAMKGGWQQTLGELDLAQTPDIAERVEAVKTQAIAVWGADADQLFADEFALYDFKLESRALADAPPETFIDQYQALVATWQHRAGALAIDSSAGRYEQAVALIPVSYSPQQKQRLRAQLAQVYLTDFEQAAITQRQEQVAQQAKQVSDYQSALSRLKQDLAEQRATDAVSMPEAQWQTYSQQQIADFRRDFFAQ